MMWPSLARILSKYCDHIFGESDPLGNVYILVCFIDFLYNKKCAVLTNELFITVSIDEYSCLLVEK